jgi:hypothetical protein
MASIIILFTIIIVIGLIVTAFSQLSRREQAETLDRQLSTQAYYAAESGVNDAIKAIQGGFKEAKTSCDPYAETDATKPIELKSEKSTLLDGSQNVKYTCLLVDPLPDTLVFGNVKTDTPTVVPIRPKTPITQLVIGWEDPSPAVTDFVADANHVLRTMPQWTHDASTSGRPLTGMLRADLLPATAPNAPTTPAFAREGANQLLANARTYFLYPTTSNVGNDTATHYSSPAFQFYDGKCVNVLPAGRAAKCEVKVNINLGGTNVAGNIQPQAFLVLRGVYRPVKVTIRALNGATPVDLEGVQYSIDSTGKAQDIVRRIHVRVPQNEEFPVVSAALQTMETLCKRLDTNPSGSSTSETTDPTCTLN